MDIVSANLTCPHRLLVSVPTEDCMLASIGHDMTSTRKSDE